MGFRISSTEETGIRCLVQLALAWERGEGSTIADVAEREGITPHYAAKLLGVLRRGGLVRSARGANGGVALARSPHEITLEDAMAVLSGGGPVRVQRCVKVEGRPEPTERDCIHISECRLRNGWGRLNDMVRSVLAGVTVAEAAGLVTNETIEAVGRRTGA